MGQGNPNKVNAIVDEIVKNNSVFKLKSPIEQDKEKDSMARSINSALSELNEFGRELVLQDLSVDPDEKFKGFIDSVGNVDISGLTQMTTTIVKAKIKEAEREGIDLRHGQSVFKDNTKALLVGGVLTVDVINNMVSNYENLTKDDRKILIDNWEKLSSKQRSQISAKKSKMLQQKANDTQDEATKQALLDMAEAEQLSAEFTAKIDDMPKGQLDYTQKVYKIMYGKRFTDFCAQQESIGNIDKRSLIDAFDAMITKEAEQDSETIYNYDGKVNSIVVTRAAERKRNERKKFVLMDEGHISSYGGIDNVLGLSDAEQQKLIDNYFKLKKSNAVSYADSEIKNVQSTQIFSIQKVPSTQNFSIQKEIEQLPNALAKDGFAQENITEALKIYAEFISGLNDESIKTFFTDKTEKELKETLSSVFEDFKEQMNPNSFEILQQLAQNDFGGHLQQILTNPQLLQETFLPALSAEIEKIEQQPIQDEHTDEYYRNQSKILQVDEKFERIVKEIQSQGGGVKEITVALAKKVEERATEQSQHSIPEKESKEQKPEQQTPPIFENPASPEEHTQESATSPEQETLEETSQNMAMVEQDNSFIGKIKRVFANMKDMKNKDNSKGFFARLGTSINNVFGNKKEEFYAEQDEISTYAKTEDKIQPTTNPQQIDYLNQHFEVNTQEAIAKTKESKKAKESLSTEDRTEEVQQ